MQLLMLLHCLFPTKSTETLSSWASVNVLALSQSELPRSLSAAVKCWLLSLEVLFPCDSMTLNIIDLLPLFQMQSFLELVPALHSPQAEQGQDHGCWVTQGLHHL